MKNNGSHLTRQTQKIDLVWLCVAGFLIYIKPDVIGSVDRRIAGSGEVTISSTLCVTPPEQCARQFLANMHRCVTCSIHPAQVQYIHSPISNRYLTGETEVESIKLTVVFAGICSSLPDTCCENTFLWFMRTNLP